MSSIFQHRSPSLPIPPMLATLVRPMPESSILNRLRSTPTKYNLHPHLNILFGTRLQVRFFQPETRMCPTVPSTSTGFMWCFQTGNRVGPSLEIDLRSPLSRGRYLPISHTRQDLQSFLTEFNYALATGQRRLLQGICFRS